MFKLESYIAPLLMGYIDKYVKLKQEDFQLSLWGGDAVLNKLDLRLDAIENALNLPITFKSGHIHELQIHVPWTRLGSEPVVITINTIECILKLRDNAPNDGDSSNSTSSPKPVRPAVRNRTPKPKEGDDLPPGYLASLMNRIMHNVNLVVNNLILKFVEDDIVLSVNVKSLECYSVNSDWTRAFIELGLPDLSLRKVVDINDLTVCLDKRNASGKIETYQDPLLYRCSLTCRLLMIHDSLHAKFPSITKFNVLCEKLDLSLTDTQLPMYCRLMELCIAIYYGTLDLGAMDTSAIDEPAATAKDIRDHIPAEAPTTPTGPLDEHGDGWVSWAWSYVPQILPPEEEELDESGRKRKLEPPVMCIGFYINKTKISFKLTETVKETQFYGNQKINFVPCLVCESEGINLEILMKGLTFFSVQHGISYIRVLGEGQSLCGTKDLEDNGRSNCYLESGTKTNVPRQTDYLTNSLFDPGGFENQGMKPEFIFDAEVHMEYYTENYGRQRFGAMWMDYLYTMEEMHSSEGGSKSSTHSAGHDEFDPKENSTIRFLFGPGEMIVSSSMVQRCHKFFYCMNDHEYEPYSRPKPEIVDESRQPPSEIEVEKMEAFIPTRAYHFTVIQPRLVILAADLGAYDVKKPKVTSYKKSKRDDRRKEGSAKSVRLPAIVIHADRLDYQMTNAMYARKVVQSVSKMSTPSANLTHHCHLHTYYKVYGLEVGLSSKEPGCDLGSVQNIFQPVSGVVYLKSLLFPVYWKNPLQSRIEVMCELPQFTVNVTKAQTMLMAHTLLSWNDTNPKPTELLNLSLMDDIFKQAGSTRSSHPVLEVSLAGIEIKYCDTEAAHAYTGTISAVQAMLVHCDGGRDSITPILYGPLDTSHLYQKDALTQKQESDPINADLITFTIQIPRKPNTPQAPGAVFVDVQGLVGSLDPKLNQWMEYSPRQLNVGKTARSPGLVVDASLVEATSPLKNTSAASQESVPTGTKSMSQSRTQTQTNTQGQEEPTEAASGDTVQQDNSWSAKMAAVFPLIKIIELQVQMKSWCAMFPSKHVELTEPSMNIPANLATLLSSGKLPDVVVVCCPSVHITSTGHKPTSPMQEIPIKALEQSFGGEKLPWSLTLSNGTVYTIQSGKKHFSVLKPASLSATIAVTTKYHPPTSDNITSLGICVHTDMETISVACANPQIQFGYNLMMSNIKSISSMLESFQILQKLYTPETEGKSSRFGSMAPTSTQPLLGAGGEGATVKMTSTSSPLENPDFNVGTITETSETASCESSPVKEMAEDKSSVKVSLWLQWTLLRFEANLYSTDKNGEELCLSAEAEDLTTAIDVQDVYAKVKCKVGALNMTHFIKRQEKWTRGNNEGIILSCNDLLSHNLQVASNKLWTTGQTSQGKFQPEDAKPIDKSHGFLLFTFTRALRKNVKKKLIKAGVNEGETKDRKVAEKGLVYLNEVCLSVQPCDIVLNCPALSMLLNVFTTVSSATGSLVKTAGAVKSPKSSEQKSSLPWFTSDVVPLVYVNATKFRMFIPQFRNWDPQLGHTPGSSQMENNSRMDDDVCVLQIESFSLVPVADNPLPRVVVEKDMYRQALQAGITSQTGSEVEDRQYQMDINGLGLSSGIWRQIVYGGRRTQKMSSDDLAQNPALEWNTLPRDESETKEVKLVPIAAGFDLKIVAAPAIVYNSAPLRPVVVCGYSLEVNAISDIDFSLSTSQVKLMNDIIVTNVLPLLNPSPQGGFSTDNEEMSATDSGVESEPSTLNTSVSRPEITITLQPKEPEQKRENQSFVDGFKQMFRTPFEVLLTAGKISFMLYSHEQIGSEAMITNEAKPHHKSARCKSDLELKETFSDDDIVSRNGYKMWPFIYSYFSQPYTLISCQRASQKIELSCYDIVLKGAKPGHVVTDEQRLIPDCGDFITHWIETRPGKVDCKTGVPPSLYTFRVSDFLTNSVEMSLNLDRPLMLNGSLSKAEQALSFTQIVTKQISIPNLTQPTSANRKTAPVSNQPSSGPAFLQYLSSLQSVKLRTTQCVVNIEGMPHLHQPRVSLVTSEISGGLTFGADEERAPDVEICGDLSIADILVTTSYRDKTRPFIGPLPLHVDASVSWSDPGSSNSTPRVLCFVDLGMVPAYFGQEHVMCAEMLIKHYTKFYETMPSTAAVSTPPRSATPPVKHSGSTRKRPASQVMDEVLDETEDDLRTGDFQYLADESFDMLVQPRVGEIIFAMDYAIGHASMTWSYLQPRAITRIKVTPVPFSLPQELDVRFIDEKLKVPCVLQHWDGLSREYLDYVKFDLSENESSSVELARPSGDEVEEIMVSTLWRVLILHPDTRQDHEEKIDTPKNEHWTLVDAEGNVSPEGPGLSPLVSPLTLAASLSIDSCYLPAHIPTVQMSVSAARVSLHMSAHLTHLGQETPTNLEPYTLGLASNLDKEFAVVDIDGPSLSLTHYNMQKKSVAQVTAGIKGDIVDGRNLTSQTFAELSGLQANATYQIKPGGPACTVLCSVDDAMLRASQSIIHTLNFAHESWTQLGGSDLPTPILNYYIICNNTREVVRLGQMKTEENIQVKCREALPYSWRTQKGEQLMRFGIEGPKKLWSECVDMNKIGSQVCAIGEGDNKITLLVTTKRLNNSQIQVELSGQITVASRLSQNVDVRLLTHKPQAREGHATLEAGKSLPSFTVQHENVRAVKIRLAGTSMLWSHEIPVTGEKMKESRLIKIPLHEKAAGFIHVWCHVLSRTHRLGCENMILLTPVFVVRTHLPVPLTMNIESPRMQTSHQVTLPGHGQEQQLHTMAGDMTHSVTFQISPQMRRSSPALSLSSGMIEQVNRKALDTNDLSSLLVNWDKETGSAWPYNRSPEMMNRRSVTSPASTHHDITVPQSKRTPSSSDLNNSQLVQPDIDLQVKLSQRWAGFNTLLIEVCPHWLIVNESGISITLLEEEDKQWVIPEGQTLAPSDIEGLFHIGIAHENQLHMSDPLTLSKENNLERYLPFIEGLLYVEGSLDVAIKIVSDSTITKMCFLTIHSTVREEMRIVTVREKYRIISWVDQPVSVQCFSVPLSYEKVTLDHDRADVLDLDVSKAHEGSNPLLIWTLMTADNQDPSDGVTKCVQYICFSYKNQSDLSHRNDDQSKSMFALDGCEWSYPTRVRNNETGSRQNLAMPILSGEFCRTQACVLTSQNSELISYLTISEEAHPSIEIHNNCNLMLHFGQTLHDIGTLGGTIQEEAELVTDLPKLPPFSSCHYSFPTHNSQFPDIQPPNKSIKLHLAGVTLESDESGKLFEGSLPWSQGIDIQSKYDVFVSIPDVADVKIHIEEVGYTAHVYIDAISRAEVSAKEIRSRIKGKEVVKVEETTPKVRKSGRRRRGSGSSVAESVLTEATGFSFISSFNGDRTSQRDNANSYSSQTTVTCSCLCQKGSFVLIRESHGSADLEEVLRISIEDAGLIYSPQDNVSTRTFRQAHRPQRVKIMIGDIQIDNQQYGRGNYDFPVVLLRQEDYRRDAFNTDSSTDEIKEVLERLSRDSLIDVVIDLCCDYDSGNQTTVQSVDLNFKPLTLYVEDIFIYEVLRVIDSMIPPHKPPTNTKDKVLIPKEITCAARSLVSPIRLKQVTIAPVALLLSVHASLKLFIASDNTPLRFAKFEKAELFTSSAQISRAVTMHYASGALFRAGLVLGSLEILGNPTGLIRGVSTGIGDLFRLPYEGLYQGPGGFITGVTKGMGSLIMNISTGTLTSITNFASSVSRNMDRLSLDPDHQERLEESRRQKPGGISQGLLNGLTGFGLSLLGAVAGIADQPLQSLTRATDPHSPPSSSSRAATGFVSAVGKGLVGVVTKPIGGAAEFVSQAGTGLLHGTGLKKMPLPRLEASDRLWEDNHNTALKFSEKLLNSVPKSSVLVQVSASQRGSKSPLGVFLLLTPEIIFVTSKADDIQLQAFSVSEVKLKESKNDPTLIHVIMKESEEDAGKWDDDIHNKERVAEFVSGAKLTKSQSEASITPMSPTGRNCYNFTVSPVERQLFLAMFKLAKNKLSGAGFPVL